MHPNKGVVETRHWRNPASTFELCLDHETKLENALNLETLPKLFVIADGLQNLGLTDSNPLILPFFILLLLFLFWLGS